MVQNYSNIYHKNKKSEQSGSVATEYGRDKYGRVARL